MGERQLVARGIKDERVLAAMRKVPRHLFVPEKFRDSAYDDGPLSIGEGQTISQPYMVALMTECLELKADSRVLEIGTGSGYQTAILAELAKWVYTVERIPTLLFRAQQLLTQLGYDSIKFKLGDGSYGWQEESPFDAIIVTAGAPEISPVLVEQLNEGGVMVIPVGSRYSQMLYRVVKRGGKVEKKECTLCIFVPLIGDHGWKEN